MPNDPLLSHREETIRYDLLDPAGQVVAIGLDKINPGGSLTGKADADIQWTGTVTTDDDIDWRQRRLRIWYTGAGVTEPLITAVVAAPDTEHSSTLATRSLELYDYNQLLARDDFGAFHAAPAEVSVVDIVVDIIRSANPYAEILIEDRGLSLPVAKVFTDAADKLTIVNDLLKAIGYSSLWCDGLGRYRSEPSAQPVDRPLAWTFAHGEVYEPGVKHSLDIYRVPNRYRCVQRTDGTIPAQVATAIDDDPASAYSYAVTGAWITQTDRDVDAAGATLAEQYTALQAEAHRRLQAAQRPAASLRIKHPYLPAVGLSGLVNFSHPRIGTMRAVVAQQSITLETGVLVTSSLQEVQ